MAASIDELIGDSVDAETKMLILESLTKQGIMVAVDVGFLDAEDIKEIADGNVAVETCLVATQKKAALGIAGWAKLEPRKNAIECSKLASASAPKPMPTPPARKAASTKNVTAACRAFTMRVAFGLKRKSPMCPKKFVGTLAQKEEGDMKTAVLKVAAVFEKHAAASPRMQRLDGAPQLMADMQLDVYKMGSKSPKVVGGRAKLAENFFEDITTCGWALGELTAFMVAAWARGRVSSGAKSAAASVRQTLRLVQAATEVNMFLDDSLVASQLQKNGAVGAEEPDKQAVEFDVDMMVKMEDLVWSGPTPQMRILAGFFAILGSSSLRASDALRTRSMKLSADAVSGVSRMKGKRCWTRWFCDKGGFSGKPWAEEWLRLMAREDLPGDDYMLKAPTAALDDWLQRPAEYADVRRGLHLILMVSFGMPAIDAVVYNPHGFRHVMVTAGQQLRALGHLADADMEVLGHWTKNSSMPRKYDAAAGVTELHVRSTLMQAFRTGWRPATEGCLPAPILNLPGVPDLRGSPNKRKRHVPDVPPTVNTYNINNPNSPTQDRVLDPTGGPSRLERHVPDVPTIGEKHVPDVPPKSDLVGNTSQELEGTVNDQPETVRPMRAVGHKKRKKIHRAAPDAETPVCNVWRCGTESEPTEHATFGSFPLDWTKCRNCWC